MRSLKCTGDVGSILHLTNGVVSEYCSQQSALKTAGDNGKERSLNCWTIKDGAEVPRN